MKKMIKDTVDISIMPSFMAMGKGAIHGSMMTAQEKAVAGNLLGAGYLGMMGKKVNKMIR